MWGGFIVAATAIALITPNGFDGLIYPIKVLSMKHPVHRRVEAGELRQAVSLEVALFFVLLICLYRGVKVVAVRLGLLLLVLYMTLQHLRQEMVLATVAPLLLAEPLGRGWRRDPTVRRAPEGWPPAGSSAPSGRGRVLRGPGPHGVWPTPGQPFNRGPSRSPP